jgi:general stress protein 26
MAQVQTSGGNSAEAVSHLVSMLRDFKEATLVTRSRSGSLHGRPMSIAQVDDNATLWFITSVGSAKVDELADDARATVTLQSAGRFACLNGNAELVFDSARIRALWRAQHSAWFDGESDPDVVLVRFHAFDAEYWDKSGVQGLKEVLQVARAYVTGHKLEQKPEEQSDPESHAKLKLWNPSERLESRGIGRAG